jgi:hypothetical protein
MNRRNFMTITVAGLASVARATRVAGQARAITPDLAALADGKRLTLVNRTASRLVDGGRTGIRLSAAAGDGLAFVPDVQLANGTIECDIRGKDAAQQSFVGVAFHGVDGSAFDAVYFRPFNFRATDRVSHGHAVQYESLPVYSWDKLRADQPGKYEQAVNPVPDPNGWFRARIVIEDTKVNVYVADAKAPSLTVTTLNGRKTGKVGVWVGNGSSGDFANLTIVPA